MSNKTGKKSGATLTLTVDIEDATLVEIYDFAKELVDKAREQGSIVGGYLDFHRVERIPVEEL